MGVIIPRPAMRKREARAITDRLAMHARFMQRLQDEGWDRPSASTEAARMVREVEKLNKKR